MLVCQNEKFTFQKRKKVKMRAHAFYSKSFKFLEPVWLKCKTRGEGLSAGLY